jgi:hypothetical protein
LEEQKKGIANERLAASYKFHDQVKFPSYVVTPKGISMDPRKVQTILD